MKHLNRSIATLAITLLVLLSGHYSKISAQQNPCLCIDTESRPCATAGARANTKFVKTGSRAINYTVVADPAPAAGALSNFPGARYKAFWIFGDGNFIYFPHSYAESDLLSLTYPYIYRRNGNYRLEAVLTEKKSNTLPPARTVRDIEIKNATPGPGTAFTQQLSGNNKTADILASDSLRPHNYLTAFAVSAPKDPSLTGIYFFYNSKVESNTVSALEMHELVELNLPDYAGTTFFKGLTSSLNNAIGNPLSAKYRNYIFVPVNRDRIVAMPPDADFNEYRIFPILKTTLRNGLPICQFLTVVVGDAAPVVNGQRVIGQNPNPSVSGGFFTPQKMEELQRLNTTYFDGTGLVSPLYYDSTKTPVYIRGMYETKVPMIGSSDPNELEVLSICPLKNGSYKVDMRVQVCNRGVLPEDSVIIRLIDHTRGGLSDFHFLTDTAKLNHILSFNAPAHTWQFYWPGGLPAVFETADTRPGETPVEVPYEPKCMEVQFSVIATLPAAQKLVQGEGLESCVTFFSASQIGIADECHFNFAIPPDQFSSGNGFNCSDPDPVPSSCYNHLLLWLLLLALCFILIWWLLRGRNEPELP